MKGFQVWLLIFFGLFVFLGVMIFSGAIKLGGTGPAGTTQASALTIWGTLPSKQIKVALDYLNTKNAVQLKYIEKSPGEYESALLNAFAFGGAPDLLLLPQSLIYTYQDKIITIPYTNFPERTFDDTYIRAVSIFKNSTGFYGFPIFSDPLVMYYNQDLLENAGYAHPPVYWSDLFDYVPNLTKKNDALQITTSGVALGEFQNVRNAKDIFSALMLQLNNTIVAPDLTSAQRYKPVFDQPSDVSSQPAVQSLKFYSEFSDPLNKAYAWNKAMKDSQTEFISGDLALYFGKASEFNNIKAKNPNLNFDVAPIPKVKELGTSTTYADVYVLAIPKTSPNAQTALTVAADLANGANTAAFIAPSGFAPVRRDLISASNLTKYNKVFYTAALNAKSWIDPNNQKTIDLFGQISENVTSGLLSPEDAVKKANIELRAAFIR